MKQKIISKQRLVMFRKWTNKSYAVFNSMHKLIKICTLSLSYSILVQPVHVKAEGADTTGNKTIEIDEVTVQATLLELKAAETGRLIDVITGAQLQLKPVSTVDELLRFLPGIETQSRGAFGAQSDFSIRGANFNQMLVLIDGHKINDPLTGHFNSNIPIAPSEIERIEIIHGSASAEFGPDAIGGVVNIITKSFLKKQQSTNNIRSSILMGEHNLINTQIGLFYNVGKASISGGSLYNKSDGNLLQSGLRNFFDIKSNSLSLRYQLSDFWSASYRYSIDNRFFNAQWFYTTSPKDSSTEKVFRERHHIQILRCNDKNTTNFSASFINTTDDYKFNSIVRAKNNTKYGLYRISHQITINKFFSTLGGIESDMKAIESNNRGNHTLNHYAAFVITNLKPVKKLNINFSFRSDYDSISKLNFIPHFGIAYDLSKFMLLKANVGYSIRTPDFTELYYNNYASSVPAGSRVGNPSLNAEKAWSYEIGSDIRISPVLSFSLSSFYRNTKDLIDYVNIIADSITYLKNLTPQSYYWMAQNNSKSTSWGIDSRIIFNYKSTFISVNGNIGYLFNNINYNSVQKPLYLLLHSKHLINGEINFEIKQLFFSLNSTYRMRDSQEASNINRYLSKSYIVCNSLLQYNIQDSKAFLTIQVYNIFNAKYADFLGAEMPGRWISAGIKFII